MLYGTGAVAILWLTAALLARWPWGIVVPLVWPAVLAAGFLAWTQALTWMPYGLPGLRVIVTVLLLAALDAVVLVALHFKAGEPVMLAILAPQVPLAFLVALFAVARARRGDVPDWRPSLARRFRTADRRARRNRCEPAPAESAVAIDVTRIDYPNCADSAAVVLYRIQGGGHTWPGGKPLPEWFVGTTSTGVDATARMWTFFREQPLSRNRQVTIPRVH